MNSDAIEYDVLFYKRSGHSNVHKAKGASKVDGILVVSERQQILSLRCAEDDASSSEDDDTKQLTWKERRKQKAKAGPRGVVHTGKHADIFEQGIHGDSTIVLGGYEVQIVSLRAPKKAVGKPVGCTSKAGSAFASRSIAQSRTSGILHRKHIAQPRKLATRPAQVAGKLAIPSSASVGEKVATASPPRPPPPRTTLPLKRKSVIQPIRSSKGVANLSPIPVAENTSTLPPPATRPFVLRKQSINVKSAAGASANVKSSLKRSTPSWTPLHAAAGSVLSHIPIPAGIRSVLQPHQVSGVDFLWRALTTDQGGAILADEMGLGKTLMSISVIAAWYRQRRAHSHIVVCPSSLVRNWEQEFDKWLGKAGQPKRMVIRTGGADGLQLIRAFAGNQSQKRANRVGQVLIVSYDLFRMHTSVLQQAAEGSIGLLVVDEGHRLKNTSGSLTMTALESLPAESRLLISASPVQNNLSEFYSLVQFVRPGLLGDLASFRRHFERPIATANRKNATRSDREQAGLKSRELEAFTKTTILRRLQSEVLASMLPPRTEMLMFCRLSQEQVKAYRAQTQERQQNISNPNVTTDALEILTGLRKICTHPALCKKEATKNVAEFEIEASGKLMVLSALLREIRASDSDSKVVIVSNFTSALSLIEDLILKPNDLSYLRLDGSVSAQNRQSLVDSFNRTSASRNFCFLLSAKAGGCGLNLVGANRLVMFDPDWNPATDLQAMGRIYRTGQKRATTIYRLFSTGTLEEIMYQRQLQKGALASVTVDGRQGQKASFSSEELKECMTLKTGTNCDTKDKIGDSWPIYKGSDQLAELVVDEATLQVAKTEMLTFVHSVDKETTESQSKLLQKSLQDEEQQEDDSSETSEESFGESHGKTTKSSSGEHISGATESVGELSDSDEEFEFP
jgi:DNA repair and recombination RAD54-like protein